jgi:hypothetical protein
MHKTGIPWPVETRVRFIVAFEELRRRLTLVDDCSRLRSASQEYGYSLIVRVGRAGQYSHQQGEKRPKGFRSRRPFLARLAAVLSGSASENPTGL